MEDVEDVRAAIAREVERTSARHVAGLVDLDHGAVRLFATGKTRRPSGEAMARYRRFLAGGGTAKDGEASPHSLDYFAGRLDEAVGYHDAIGARLRQLVTEMRAASAGAAPPATGVNPSDALAAAADAQPLLPAPSQAAPAPAAAPRRRRSGG